MPDLKPKIVEPFRCSFCGKDQHQVRRLIAGISGFICEECVKLCADIDQGAEAEQRLLADGKQIVSAADAERLAWMKTWTVAQEGCQS